MKNNWPILIDILIISVVASVLVFVFKTYQEPVLNYLRGGGDVAIHVRDIPLRVSVADTDAKRQQGLSGVTSLDAEEGMLFVFDKTGDYLFWMKDMNFPIDIFWIDEDFKIVHIEENVKPEYYPARYGSTEPARLVLETNAFFAKTFNIKVGDRVSIPENRLPVDLRER